MLFSCTVMSDSATHDMGHARLPYLSPSPSPRACLNSCLLSRWCHPSILSSVIPFSSCLLSFPASGPFPVSWLLHQVAKVLEFQLQHLHPMNIQGWFPLGLTGLISLQFKGLSRVFSSTTIQKHQFFSTQPSLWSKFYWYSYMIQFNCWTCTVQWF